MSFRETEQRPKDINKLFDEIDKIWRAIQKSSTSTIATISNPASIPEISDPVSDHNLLTNIGDRSHPDLDNIGELVNGTFLEDFKALVTSNGTLVTMSLTPTAGVGDLQMVFSDGISPLDCDPALTVELTILGTDTVPIQQFVYILQSDKILTVGTSFPSAEHIQIGDFVIPSPSYVQSYGVYKNQNINNYIRNEATNQGRIQIMGEKIRLIGIDHISGFAGVGVDSYFTFGAGTGYFKASAGVFRQMHEQSVAAMDMSVSTRAQVVNDSVTAYAPITNLSSITKDRDGNALANNKYYNLVCFISANKSGEFTPLFINLPKAGAYTLQQSAIDDVDNTAVYDIPAAFKSTGKLIVRLTFQYGGTWTWIAEEDLKSDNITSGSGGGGSQVEFSDAVFKVFKNADPSSYMHVDASAMTAPRAIAMPDSDRDLELLDEDTMSSDSATKAASQQSIKAYIDDKIPIGLSNAEYYPCIVEGDASGNFSEVLGFGGIIKNNSATNMNISYVLPLRPVVGSLTLTITDVRVLILLADGNDYVSLTRVFTADNSAQNTKYTDNTDLTSTGDYISGGGTLSALTNFALVDAQRCAVQIFTEDSAGASADLQIAGVFLKCYYS